MLRRLAAHGMPRAARVSGARPAPDPEAAERARSQGAPPGSDEGDLSDGLSFEGVPLNLSLPAADWWGDWVDAELEGAYRQDHMLPELSKHFLRGASLLLCASTLFAVTSVVSLGVGFTLTLAAASCILALLGVLFTLVQRWQGLSLEATEAGIIALLILFTSVPITPARLANLLQQTNDAVSVRAESEEDLQFVTTRFDCVLFYCAIFIPLRPRRFAVFIGCTWLAQVSQQLLLAPGSTATNVRDSLGTSLALALALHARQHIFKIGRAQWHFHRRVRGAVLERYEQERSHVRERLELATVRAGKEARSRLIRVAMHDLRSPLLSVHSLAQAMQAMDEEQPLGAIREMIGALGALSHLMEGIVSDMLDFERIDSGRIAVAKAPLAISDVLDSARYTFATVAAAKGVELRIEPLPEELAPPHRFEGDVRRLAQALNNGCSNAIKFTDAGGAVTVSAWRAARPPAGREGGGWHEVHIAVVDTGAGLSAAELRALQDGGIFTQVGRGQLQGNGGTGLGLSISKELLKLHDNSELRLHSDGEGRGTRFEMVLALKGAPPLAEADASSALRALDAALAPQRSSSGGALSTRLAQRVLPPACEQGLKAEQRPSSDPAASRVLAMRARQPRSRADPVSLRGAGDDGEGGAECTPPGSCGRAEAAKTAGGAAEPSGAAGHHRARVAAHAPGAPMNPHALTAPEDGVDASAGLRRLSSARAFPPGFRCLHVEDDKFVQMTLPLATFELVGVGYDTADDGEQAVQMAGARHYDLILMDNQMPRLTGTQATRTLRQRGFKGRIIGMTGDPEGSDDRLAFEQAGLDACVDKTSDGNRLVLRELLSLGAPPQTTEGRPAPRAAAPGGEPAAAVGERASARRSAAGREGRATATVLSDVSGDDVRAV